MLPHEVNLDVGICRGLYRTGKVVWVVTDEDDAVKAVIFKPKSQAVFIACGKEVIF